MTITNEKERNTFEQLAMSPVRPSAVNPGQNNSVCGGLLCRSIADYSRRYLLVWTAVREVLLELLISFSSF